MRTDKYLFFITILLVFLEVSATDYYFCQCDLGSDSDCINGDDSSLGTSQNPWQSYEKARITFNTMQAGDSVNFCKGGYWNVISSNSKWVNSNCRADNVCQVKDFTANWASNDVIKPIIDRQDGQHMFALVDGGQANHEEGYEFKNLEIKGNGLTGFGFFLYNDIDDVLMDNVTISGFLGGVALLGSHLCDTNDATCDAKNSRIVLSNSRVINNKEQGWIGSSTDSAVLNNYFDNNGNRASFDHNIYISGANHPIGVDNNGNEVSEHYMTDNMRVIGNQLYHSALDVNGICQGTSLVSHGLHNNMIIESNTVIEDVGFAGQGCWGIAVDAAYPDPESFTNLVIRNNTVRNVGNMGIGVSSCQNCIIENNIIQQSQNMSMTAISVPDRSFDGNDAMNDTIIVRNNSIYINNSAAAGTAIKVNDQGSNHVVVSNAIHYDGNSGFFNCLATNLSTQAFDAIDNNICYHPNMASVEWADKFGTLSNWQVTTGFDNNSFELDPDFFDKANAILSAQTENSIMIDTGNTSFSSVFDISTSPRDMFPDIGAYEWIFDDLIFTNGFE